MSQNKWTRGKWKAFRKPIFDNDEGHLTGIGTDPDRWVLKSEIEHRPPQDGIVRTTIHFAEFFRCGQMSDEELEANVRLCKAGPVMAEALERAFKELMWAYDNMEAACLKFAADECRAALSLARGEAK